MAFRVTYATLSADDSALHAAYDVAVEQVRSQLGRRWSARAGERALAGAGSFTTTSPLDRDVVVGEFAVATPTDVDAAVGAAAVAARRWAGTPWPERAAILDRAADLISARSVELAALMAWEIGKNRLEALGDVEESADLIRYYTHQLREHDGFVRPMERLDPRDTNTDVMRPHGVWAVISPFNYPMALVAGPAGAALAAGNTVVLKPSEIGSLCGMLTYELLVEAGVPPGVVNVVTGPGETVGAALVADPRVAGLTFTGSSAVGMDILRRFSARWPKPAVCEMGGKNPVILTASADLDLAVEGVARSAFGFAGQKCSAASRAFVAAERYDEFCARLVARAAAIPPTSPLERDGYLSPVIDEAAVARFDAAVAGAERVLVGGTRLRDGHHGAGTYVAPTVATAPLESGLWTTELFVPFLLVHPVADLNGALALANGVPNGLTAGLFAAEPGEIAQFCDEIEAGVLYVNRAAGATTGAWPGVQPFGGWKLSGTAGKAGGGPYYLQQYLREQSRTITAPAPG
jgi:1-pyrroline-5-carboxylate dehydrogenase